MVKLILILGLLVAVGCHTPREMKLCRVIDVSTLQPISGAKVHVQPYAPIHPFWPKGATGITNANGEVNLSLPSDYWMYFSDATATGYRDCKLAHRPLEPATRPYAVFLFCMKRDSE